MTRKEALTYIMLFVAFMIVSIMGARTLAWSQEEPAHYQLTANIRFNSITAQEVEDIIVSLNKWHKDACIWNVELSKAETTFVTLTTADSSGWEVTTE